MKCFIKCCSYLAPSGISDISPVKEEIIMEFFINCYIYAALNEI